MRVRIRGPSGKSTTATLDDSATVETLRQTIATETGLSSFDVKAGYPPKALPLDQYPGSKLLLELDVKLNGEQLIVNAAEPSAARKDSTTTTTTTTKPGQQPTSGNGAQQTQASPGSSNDHHRNVAQRPPANAGPTLNKFTTAAEPLSLTRKENKEMTTDPPEIFLPDLGGSLVLRIMPDDNSCLFRAVASAVLSDVDAVTELRSIVAQTIQANPEKYTKAILDNKEPDAYCRWIQSEDAWGGQIELDILSRQFDIEICSLDVQTLRVDRYNEGAARRCFVVYSGIHYDTIALSLFGMSPENDVKQFEEPLSTEVLASAIALCQKLQDRHYYTDTAGFRLKCGDCGAVCVGEAGATRHAKDTGHYNFGEAA